MSKKIVCGMAALFFLGLLFVPVDEVTIVPEWKIQVVNGDGSPAAYEELGEGWMNYSVEFWRFGDHIDKQKADVDGVVVFPQRTISLSALHLLFSGLRDQFASINMHASYGNHAYVFCINHTGCRAFYADGQDLPSQIVVN